MGLMNKLKSILFEEEEVEIPVIEKKQEPLNRQVEAYKEMPRKEENVKKSSFYDDLEPVIKEEKKLEEQNREVKRDFNTNTASVSEREIFKAEKTFNFPAFDEKEFESVVPKQKPRPTNIMEHERKVEAKKQESIREYKRVAETENKDKTKFRPSPIISPVYGILDKNYTPDEITSRNTNEMVRKLDVDSVRKKAFGIEETKKQEVIINEKTEEDKILEEKLEKARTIDELLKDSSDEVITIREDKGKEKIEPILEEEEKREVPEEIETILDEDEYTNNSKDDKEEKVELKENKTDDEDDTLESDLFDLIDSMYENREDGE